MYDLRIIKRLRQQKGMTQSQLAELSGLDRSYISRLETDNIYRDRSPTLQVIEKLALALNVCAVDLIWYECSECLINETCKKKDKVDLNNLKKETLQFYR